VKPANWISYFHIGWSGNDGLSWSHKTSIKLVWIGTSCLSACSNVSFHSFHSFIEISSGSHPIKLFFSKFYFKKFYLKKKQNLNKNLLLKAILLLKEHLLLHHALISNMLDLIPFQLEQNIFHLSIIMLHYLLLQLYLFTSRFIKKKK